MNSGLSYFSKIGVVEMLDIESDEDSGIEGG